MTTNAEEETNPPEMLDIVWLDGLVGRALEFQSKGRGFKSHSSQSFRISTTRLTTHLLFTWRNSHLWIHSGRLLHRQKSCIICRSSGRYFRLTYETVDTRTPPPYSSHCLPVQTTNRDNITIATQQLLFTPGWPLTYRYLYTLKKFEYFIVGHFL